QQLTPASITTGISGLAYAMEELQSSYRQAIEAVEGKMFLGKGSLIKYEDVRAEPGMLDSRMLDAHMNKLLAAMEGYELVRICDEVEGLFGSI
ncbi:hypothetical protein, partial [Salmonella enterica]